MLSTAGLRNTALQLLVFDTTQEKFRLTEAPECRGSADLITARIGVLSGGRLCTFAVDPTMEMWVLDDYSSNPCSWQLKEKISLVTWDKHDYERILFFFTTLALRQLDKI